MPRAALFTFTEGELADMASSVAAGVTLRELGERYGCSGDTIRARLLDAGLDLPRRRPRLSDTERAMIEDYVRQGFSVTAITEHLGRSQPAVSAVIRELGLPYRNAPAGGVKSPRITNGRAHRVDADTVRRIVAAARRNHTLTAAAAEAGVDVKTLERVLGQEAPVVGNRLKRSYPVPVEVIDNYAGDLAQVPEIVRHYGLVSDTDYENVAADHGAEYVQSLIDRLGADRTAASLMIADLRRGLERHRARAAREATRNVEYLTAIPKSAAEIPPGRVVVHNNVVSARRLGVRGFRAWLADAGAQVEPCDCGWAPELGGHYRVAAPSRRKGAPVA